MADRATFISNPICDFSDITDSWKLVVGEKWVQGTTMLDQIISIFGCLKPVPDSYFQFRPAIFRFSRLIVLGFNDTSTLEGHFVSSPREREKRDRRESRGDEREGQGRKRNRNESEETEEIKTFPLYPYPLQG